MTPECLITPLLHGSSPSIASRSDDLPQPTGPVITTSCFPYMSKEIFCSVLFNPSASFQLQYIFFKEMHGLISTSFFFAYVSSNALSSCTVNIFENVGLLFPSSTLSEE